MTELFLKIVNMSISAGWLVLAVLVLRFFLKKAPKWSIVTLWGIVAARLLFPFSIESALSLIPSAETVTPEIMTDTAPMIQTGIPVINNTVNSFISQTFAPATEHSVNPMEILIPALAVVWVLGIILLLGYTAISYLRLRLKVNTAVRLRDNIYQSEQIDSPFVLGVIKPRIYLPFSVNGEAEESVIAHETAHIRRKDHLWKPFGFLLMTVHWFNPLMWLAYILLCRDIEFACDERVIRNLGHEQRADYSQALLACSVRRRTIAACPIAFGEVGVKERVKTVLNYKKPAFWIVVASVVICIIVGVCFLTDPIKQADMPSGGETDENKANASLVIPSEMQDWPPLEEISRNYSMEQAITDGCVVIDKWNLVSGEKYWINFVNATYSGRAAAVRIYEIDPSSDIYYVKYLYFDGEKYVLQYDDKNSLEVNISTSQYKYLVRDRSFASSGEYELDNYMLMDFSAADTSVIWSSQDYYSNSHLIYSVAIESDEYYVETFYGIVFADIDKDGKEEKCCLGMGRTSGVFTFSLSAYENDELKYSNTYMSEFYSLSFVQDKNGKLRIQGTSQGDEPETHLFDIVVTNGNLELRENGEALASATNHWNQ